MKFSTSAVVAALTVAAITGPVATNAQINLSPDYLAADCPAAGEITTFLTALCARTAAPTAAPTASPTGKGGKGDKSGSVGDFSPKTGKSGGKGSKAGDVVEEEPECLCSGKFIRVADRFLTRDATTVSEAGTGCNLLGGTSATITAGFQAMCTYSVLDVCTGATIGTNRLLYTEQGGTSAIESGDFTLPGTSIQYGTTARPVNNANLPTGADNTAFPISSSGPVPVEGFIIEIAQRDVFAGSFDDLLYVYTCEGGGELDLCGVDEDAECYVNAYLAAF